MSDEEKSTKHYESSPEKTLITLEQLSQTIEVMTSVVNRLRQHLSEQLENQLGVQNETKQNPVEEKINTNTDDSFEKVTQSQDDLPTKAVLEIKQPDLPIQRKSRKILH
tara:strand:+ start:1030 stop:1356 length:327 start_codon:yes stop_codon:yes gene_type:complete